MDDVFHLQGNASHLIIKHVGTGSTQFNDNLFGDILYVEYKGDTYELDWNDFDSCYEGEIEGKNGYVY